MILSLAWLALADSKRAKAKDNFRKNHTQSASTSLRNQKKKTVNIKRILLASLTRYISFECNLMCVRDEFNMRSMWSNSRLNLESLLPYGIAHNAMIKWWWTLRTRRFFFIWRQSLESEGNFLIFPNVQHFTSYNKLSSKCKSLSFTTFTRNFEYFSEDLVNVKCEKVHWMLIAPQQ